MSQLTNIFSTIAEGDMANAQGIAQQKIANYNAQLARREGKARLAAAELESQRIARKSQLYTGRQKAVMGKSGISGTSGSSVDVLADAAVQFAMDENLALRRGFIEQHRLNAQASLMQAQGKMARKQGKIAQRISYFKAAGQTADLFFPTNNSSSSTQKPLTSNQQTMFNAGYGPVSSGYADYFMGAK